VFVRGAGAAGLGKGRFDFLGDFRYGWFGQIKRQ
jgi:hypothetical protein